MNDVKLISILVDVDGKKYYLDNYYSDSFVNAQKEPELALAKVVSQTMQESCKQITDDILKPLVERKQNANPLPVILSDLLAAIISERHPYTCGQCGKELSEKKPLCDECLKKIAKG